MDRPLINISPYHLLGFCFAITLFELLTYMASDMIMPAMLTVTHDLNASAQHIPFAFNLYLAGGVLLQWLIGPLSDHFGRRKMLLIGCALFALACAAAFSAQSIYAFNGLRLIQGMGLGFVIAVSYPALQEIFCEADAVKIMALLGNVALLSPLLGPLLGSLLLEWLTWRELFLLLGMSGLLVWLALYVYMPETVGTLRHDGQRLMAVPFEWGGTVRRYAALLGNPRFLSATVALGIMSLPLIAWIGLAPLLLMNNLGLSSLTYGLWQIPVFAAVILGNLILNRLIAKTEIPQLIRYALWPLCGGLVALVILSAYGVSTPLLISCLGLYAVGLGMSNAALYRLALFTSDDSKGLVSAMIGMISIVVMGAGGSILAAVGAGNSHESFALMAGIAGLLCLLPLRFFLRRNAVALPV
jgi:DHA1 family multidrug/chloramphenicol efflux transport protein-like MFS transporter